MTQGTATKPASTPHRLKTGAEYKESLKDNRQIWVGGSKLNSVYDEPALARGIDLLASMFDDQFTEEHADATTYYDEKAGAVLSRSWQIPRTKEDLAARRRMIEYTSLKTAGTICRPSRRRSRLSTASIRTSPKTSNATWNTVRTTT
jgi:4-hydroxyphenylacetate 3-monooxygenase